MFLVTWLHIGRGTNLTGWWSGGAEWGECGVCHSLFALGGRCGLLLFLAGFKGVPDNLNSIPERDEPTQGEDGDTCK